MNNIKELRLGAGLTQAQLAEMSGVSKRSIENWECGYRIPRDVYTLHKVANVLKCSIEDLINFEEEKSSQLLCNE